MPDPLVVDVHVHLFQEADDPIRDGYEIWEYGELPAVASSDRRGTLDDLLGAVGGRPQTHCVVLGMFSPRPGRSDGHGIGEEARRLQAENAWLLATAARSPHLSPLVAADPSVMGGEAGAAALRHAVAQGARGIKVHPIVQNFEPDDPRMGPVYETCQEMGLTVLSHAGRCKGERQTSSPSAFANVMDAYPGLHLVLADLGGASWTELAGFAAAYPSVSFDLCEIIAWTGAPHAPSRDQLGRLIREVGADRVLFGTDFPWYDLETTIDQLMDLPHLSDEERRGILGENAVRRMQLDLP